MQPHEDPGRNARERTRERQRQWAISRRLIVVIALLLTAIAAVLAYRSVQ